MNQLVVKSFQSHIPRLPFQCVVGSSSRPRVDVELVLILECLELVCVSRDEDVYVQLSLEQGKAGHVSPGDDLVAVDQTDLKLAHRHHLLLRVVQVLEGKLKRNVLGKGKVYKLHD